VTGELAVVGVTGPPDFLVKRLLKKLANAPSFAAVLLPPGVVFGWFLGRPGIDGVCEPIPLLTPDVIAFRVITGVAFSSVLTGDAARLSVN